MAVRFPPCSSPSRAPCSTRSRWVRGHDVEWSIRCDRLTALDHISGPVLFLRWYCFQLDEITRAAVGQDALYSGLTTGSWTVGAIAWRAGRSGKRVAAAKTRASSSWQVSVAASFPFGPALRIGSLRHGRFFPLGKSFGARRPSPTASRSNREKNSLFHVKDGVPTPVLTGARPSGAAGHVR